MNLVLFLVSVIVLSPRRSIHITLSNNCSTSMLVITVALIFDYLWLKCNLLLLCGDIELNPGPKQKTANKIFIFHWNLNSIVAHNFAKLVLLKACKSVHKWYKFFIGNISWLNILPDDSNLKIPGYNLVRSDHPSNKRRWGLCIYYKSYLPLRIIDINYLNEYAKFELMVGDRIWNFIVLYRYPSQS